MITSKVLPNGRRIYALGEPESRIGPFHVYRVSVSSSDALDDLGLVALGVDLMECITVCAVRGSWWLPLARRYLDARRRWFGVLRVLYQAGILTRPGSQLEAYSLIQILATLTLNPWTMARRRHEHKAWWSR